jgi:FkbM family methyltransferase
LLARLAAPGRINVAVRRAASLLAQVLTTSLDLGEPATTGYRIQSTPSSSVSKEIDALPPPERVEIAGQIMLTTKTKVSLAALAYRFIAFARGLVGKSKSAIVRRGGICWDLDLSEGIDFSIYLLGAFEPGTAKTLQELVKPGDVVLDIGANIGAHTLRLAQSVGPGGKVYAFEPADFAFAKLKRNLALNPELESRTSPQQLLLVAMLSQKVEQEIYASWPLETVDSVHPKHRGRLVSTTQAIVETLDGFARRHGIARLDLIKMDVDGHELPVLRGGMETLLRFHPVLVMEMSPYVHFEQHNSFADFVELLKNAGYSLRNADNGKAVPLNDVELQRLIPDGASINVVGRADAFPSST